MTRHMGRRYRSPSEDEMRQRLRVNVRTRRDAASLPVREVAGRVKMHLRHWQKIEAGDVNITLMTLARLCVALGVDVKELLREPTTRDR